MAGLAGNWCCPGQHQEKGLYHISPAQEKLKIQSTVSAEWVSLLHHLSGESVRWTIASRGILYSEYKHRSLFPRGSRFLFKLSLIYERTSEVAQMVKNLPAMREPRVPSLGWKDPWRRERLSTSVFLAGESHGLRNLMGYSSWSHRESDNN